MPALQTRYDYKIYRDGVYLGMLPNVTSDFGYSQSINTAATSLSITVGLSADTSHLAVEAIQTETPADLQAESSEVITTERYPDVVGNNSNTLIRNNNDIKVYEISADNPNGLLVFSGYISRWNARFGSEDDIVLTCLNYGTELDNYLIQGNETTDQQQNTQDTSMTTYTDESFYSTSWLWAGQTFTTGTGVTNLSSITLRLAATAGGTYVTVKLFSNAAEAFSASLGSTQQYISSATPADYTFTFPTAIPVSAGQSYFFSVSSFPATGCDIYYDNSDSYASGSMWVSSFGGGGGAAFAQTPCTVLAGSFPASDLYFTTTYSSGATSSPFLNSDPGVIVTDIIDSYNSRGGQVTYTIDSVWATTTEVDYTFQVNTILEGVKKCLDLAPSNWYWYVDPATNVIYFRETASVAAHTLILGKHIESLELMATVENVRTQVYFTGGSTGANNLYLTVSDTAALAANNQRVGLERITDNRVTLQSTGLSIAQGFLDNNNAETYETSVTIPASCYDISDLSLGEVIGFAGFGTIVDSLLLQIVSIKRTPDEVALSLGRLPRRQTAQVEAIERALREVQTVDNPDVPS